MGSTSESVCVTGASGFIGSWLVMRLMERGYTVRATVRDPENMKKVKHLVELPGAKTKLSLWKADLAEEGSFDEAIKGCTGVFHVATPMDFESKDPENEVIKPTIKGLVDIMKACVKAKSVRRIVFTSSAGTVDVAEKSKPFYDENCWSDIEFCRRVKMTGWMYFVSKTLAEKEAWKFAKEHNIDFVSVIPPLVVGPFLMPTMPPSLITALSLITGNEGHYHIIKQGQFVHLDDLCLAHIFLFEFRRICVYCGSSPGRSPSYQLAAVQLGKQLVERKIDLVYGGGSIGLMGLISQVVYDGGRHVLGVIPKTLNAREITGESVGEVRAVSGMHQRKAEMARQADAFIALPGGYGTLEELLEIITWAQLGIHDKPVGLLNVDGYYNSLLAFMDKAVDEGFVTPAARHIIVSAQTAQDLMCKLEEYVPEHCGVAPKLSWEMEQQLVNTAKSDISR